MSNRRRLPKPKRPRCRKCRSTALASKTLGDARRRVRVCRACGAEQGASA